jgi:Putative transposase
MTLWRFAVTSYLSKAHQDGLLQKSFLPKEFNNVILKQVQRIWNIHITRRMSKKQFLGYAGRYIRRLPIAQKRILKVTKEEVVHQYKDTQQSKETRMKIMREARCTPTEFVAKLSQHVLERHQHSMRYFRPASTPSEWDDIGCRLSSAGSEAAIPPAAPELAKLPAPRLPHRSPPRQPRPANEMGPPPLAEIGLSLLFRRNDTLSITHSVATWPLRFDFNFCFS